MANPPPRPHVDADGRWVGHDSGREDVHYHVEHPWARGHFTGPMGQGHMYHASYWAPERHRFGWGQSYFVVAGPDWGYADDWDWNHDQVVFYDDPDHDGYYLAYNTRLETYIHVQYDGGE